MRYTIQVRDGYLRGEMVERESAEETRLFSEAMYAAIVEKRVSRVLVVVRASAAIFRVEEFGLSGVLDRLSEIRGLRVALVSDSREVAAAHEYMQLIATQHGVTLCAFAAERPALQWLLRD